MNRVEYLLQCLQEECVEIAKDSSKANRFGLEDKEDLYSLTNKLRLISEINDFIGVVELMQDEGILPNEILNRDMIENKKLKILKYMDIFRTLGTLVD